MKVSKNGIISRPHFPVFSPNTGKYRPEITPYLDTFHAKHGIKKRTTWSNVTLLCCCFCVMNKFSLWPSISIQKQYLNNSEISLILLDVAHQHHFCFNLTTKLSYYLAILNETQSLCNLINEATLNFSKLQLFKIHF